MKKLWCGMIVCAVLVWLAAAALAAVGTGWDDDCRANPGSVQGTYGKHNWVKQWEEPGNDCMSAGQAGYACSYCGAAITRTTPAPGHSWGPWTVTQAATCQSTGIQVRTCSVCGSTETKSIAKTDHHYGIWIMTVPPSCQTAGSQTRTCTDCTAAETQTIPKVSHPYGPWKVVREATCRAKGLQRRTCKVCGEKQDQSIRKTGHQYADWVITVEATDHSAGERTAACIWCGRSIREAFDPEGTLRRGDKGNEVKELQLLLADDGYLNAKNAQGTFNQTTEKAVSRFQKDHGLKADGIAWPQTRRLLAHDWSDWEIVVDETPFSAGIRRRTCNTCGKIQEEEFDPEGTLRRNDEGQAVRELQVEMKALGIFDYNTTGQFGRNTENSVKNFQKEHGLKADGIAWPGVIAMIFGREPKEPSGKEEKLESPVLPVHSEGGMPMITVSIHDVQSAAPIPGKDVSFYVTIANIGGIDVELVGISQEKEDVLFSEAWMVDGLEAGKSYEAKVQAKIGEEDAEAGWLSRTVTVTVRDPVTGHMASGSDSRVIPFIEAGAHLTVYLEDTAGWTIGEGDSAEVMGWVINTGTESLTSLALSYADGKENLPVNDDLTGVPGILPDPFHSGDAIEFVYHCKAMPEDTAAGVLMRRVTAEGVGILSGESVHAFDDLIIECPEKAASPSFTAADGDSSLALSKSIQGKPENGAFYVPGEIIRYELTVTNLSETLTAQDVLLDDPRTGCERSFPLLLPGQTVTAACDYEVTKLDAAMKNIINQAMVSWKDSEGIQHAVSSNPAAARTGFGSEESLRLEVIKTELSHPSNQLFYQKGEQIDFQITVINRGNGTIEHIEIFDLLEKQHAGRIGEIQNLSAHGSVSLNFSYQVTGADVGAGSVANTAFAVCSAAGYVPQAFQSEPVVCPTGVFPAEITDGPCIAKAETSAPLNGSYYTEGETISYAITVINFSPVSIMSGEIADVLAPEPGVIASVQTLLPNEFVTVPYTYTVTAMDVAQKSVTNLAAFSGTLRNQTVVNIISNEVISPTGAGQRHKGGTSCVRTLLQHSASMENAKLEYCPEHAAVADRVEKIVARAGTEAERLAAWQTAAEIWTEALNREYQELLITADPAATSVIQEEWVQFRIQLAAYRDAMILPEGSETSEIAEQVTELIMNHCADLCEEASVPAEERKDSIFNAAQIADIGLMPLHCLRQKQTAENGLSLSSVLCSQHQRTERIMGDILTGVSTEDQHLMHQAFQTAESLWTAELDREAYQRFRNAGDEGELVIAERLTFSAWLSARKAMLDAEYPDHPGMVQELIVRNIRERVIQQCSRH